MQACDRCHARKTRCDRRIPQCTACEKARVPCLHADKLRQKNYPRGYIDIMEKNVEELRKENSKLRRQMQRMARSESTADGSPGSFAEPPNAAGLGTPQSSDQAQEAHGDDGLRTPPHMAPSSSSESHGANNNAYAAEVGYLTLNASGETRYLGSSSGMGLASMISSAISAQSGMSFSMDSSASVGHAVHPLHITPLDPYFPSLPVARPFLEAYFQHTHVTFPLIHRPSFMASVDRIYQEPGYYESNPFTAFVFDMVLAIGSSNFNVFEDASSNSSTYYAMAQSKISSVMAMDGLSVLKAILLICHHAIFSNLRDTSASIWHLIGIGVRLCFELGLHLEPRQLNQAPGSSPHEESSTALAGEMRKRCFWCLYNLDRIASCTLGRPLAIRDEDTDVSLPCALDSDEISGDQPIEASGNPDDHHRLSPFIHLIRIRRISGQILSLFYNSRQATNVRLEEKQRVRQRFYEEIVAWKLDTERLALYRRDSNQGYVSSFWSTEWYTAVYSNAMLLLYRPSPYLPHPTMIPALENDEAELGRLLRAAGSSIESYSILHRKRRLNYSWITLHGVFLAGLAYVYSIGRILRDPTYGHQAPDSLSVIDVTRACSNVLVAICERWNVSRRSCELFDNLSNAVIRDSLNAGRRTQPAAPSQPGRNASAAEAGTLAEAEHENDQGSTSMPYYSVIEERMLSSLPQLDDIFVMDELRQWTSSNIDSLHQMDDGLLAGNGIPSLSQTRTLETQRGEQDDTSAGRLEESIVVDTGTESLWTRA